MKNIVSFEQIDLKTFKVLILSLSSIILDIQFIITKDNINILSIDEKNVTVLNMNLPKSNFNHFVCENEKVIFNIVSKNLEKILKKCNNSILFYINEEDNCLDKYPINISILIDKSYKLKLRMNENHNNQENVVIDEEIYRNRFSIQSTDFIKMIKYLQDISKRLNITITNKVITCNAFNDNCFFTNEIDEIELESHIDLKVDIILNKLVFFIKIMALSETILISLDAEEPCKFSIIIKDNISINYYIMNNNFLP